MPACCKTCGAQGLLDAELYHPCFVPSGHLLLLCLTLTAPLSLQTTLLHRDPRGRTMTGWCWAAVFTASQGLERPSSPIPVHPPSRKEFAR